MISLKEAQEKWPFMRVDDLKGILWMPDEGVISPTDVCTMLARGATNQVGQRIRFDYRTNQGTFGKPHWFKNVEEECKACRDTVAVVDLTCFGLFELESQNTSESLELLQSLCVNDIDIPIGHAIHTSMLNEIGGYEVQCTVIRRAKNRFLIVTKPTLTTHTESWISRNKDPNSDITITDIQSNCSILGILGPNSREVLQQLTLSSLEGDDFPLDSLQVLDLDYASDLIFLHTSDVYGSGSGWQLFVDNDQVETLYNHLMSTGKEYGIRNMGWYALNNISIEKGLPMIGEELVPSITPYDVGLDSSIDYNKTFIGKNALLDLKDKSSSSSKKLVHMVVKKHDDDCIPWGGETVVHDGDVIGHVTSTAFDFKLGHPVCLGFIESKGEAVEENRLEINIADKMYPVHIVKNN
ncbi:pyruvate dehydrogenase phosphatase regulatory subunit, mitochondrial-like [Actinia tenebrosa]|uniref:Pyruvate dehydrogenase phosphatase regulatory subunit, mitochondrial-like n=1 Tax=Actinia tenebrosa TaxID=6105 RepID=A0A6P8HAV1_ACTTE|nr:pyruvate dehydrogenase phosphatase regulatory subunit, mitochondrial-like [Actinia tenebrosa]